MTATSDVLHGCKNLLTIQGLPSQCRHMGVFLKALLPISLRAANIAKIALSASKLVNYTRQKRFWEFVLERKTGRQSNASFENDFELAEGNVFLEGSDEFIFHFPRRGSKKRKNYHQVQLWNSVNQFFLLIKFIEKVQDAFINKL